jgi:hypothetical protein
VTDRWGAPPALHDPDFEVPDGYRRDELVPGPILFSRYAYPPNALGYCGPSDASALLAMAAQEVEVTELAHRAAQFEGAWPYLQLIAGANRIADPLDPNVVEAYWTGNALLDNVPARALAASVDDRFARRASKNAVSLGLAALTGIAQHSFHVFAVYPWLGLLRDGAKGVPLEILDRCRIRWGTVEDICGDEVLVRGRHLRFEGSRLHLGPERTEAVRLAVDGCTFAPDLRRGDLVAAHWDWVCERLSAPRARWLRYCTGRNLRAVNDMPAPPPTVVCEA